MLSIIVPTLNEEKYLPKLLKSIKKQNYKNYEIIVADANSIDNTRKIAKKYKCKVIEGGTPPVGRNKGAKKARGNYLLFLDADVILPKYFLKNMLKEFEERNLDIASCYIYPISNKKIDFILHEICNLYLKLTQYFYPHAPGFCILIKKEIHKKIKGFDEEIKLAEDHDYVKRASRIGIFRLINSEKILVSVRRLDRDGRINIFIKYLVAEFNRIMIGEIKSNIFGYKYKN